MSILAENLKRAMTSRGISQGALAEMVGCSQTAISKLLTGKSERSKYLAEIAHALQVPIEDLTGIAPSASPRSGGYPENQPARATPLDRNVEAAECSQFQTVPLISSVAAGRLTEIVDPYTLGACEKEISVIVEVSRYAFALRITGDSMMPEYAEGDIVIIDPAVRPQPGDCVAAKNDEEEATFKKFRPRGRNDAGVEYFELVPLNPDYPTIRSDIEHLKIIGTEVQHNRIKRRKKISF